MYGVPVLNIVMIKIFTWYLNIETIYEITDKNELVLFYQQLERKN